MDGKWNWSLLAEKVEGWRKSAIYVWVWKVCAATYSGTLSRTFLWVYVVGIVFLWNIFAFCVAVYYYELDQFVEQ